MTRKEAILKAAIELFMEKGYNGTATSEIAERAGVAHGTVFHHFGKKENLLLELTEATIKEIYERTANFPTEGLSGLDALIKTLRMTLEFIDLRWNSIYVLMQYTPILMSPNMI